VRFGTSKSIASLRKPGKPAQPAQPAQPARMPAECWNARRMEKVEAIIIRQPKQTPCL